MFSVKLDFRRVTPLDNLTCRNANFGIALDENHAIIGAADMIIHFRGVELIARLLVRWLRARPLLEVQGKNLRPPFVDNFHFCLLRSR